MAKYRRPGLYINEIKNFPPSVTPVTTAIPAFIGYTEKRMKQGKVLDNALPVKIDSLLEYEEIFGGAYNEKLTAVINGQSTTPANTSVKIEATTKFSPYNLYYNLNLYFKNGGGPCYIVSVGLYTEAEIPAQPSVLIKYDKLYQGLVEIEKIDEVTLLVIPEAIHLINSERKNLYDNMLAQCGKLKDRFAILDVYRNPFGSVSGDANDFRNNLGVSNLRFGAAYYPPLKTVFSLKYENSGISVSDQRLGIVNNENTSLESLLTGPTADPFLFDIITKEIKRKFEVILYPSSAIAGLYVMVDNLRGVWKAPANVNLSMIKEPVVSISNTLQSILNVDVSTGKSINTIRSFPGTGVLVWGARTLAGNDNEWRYVSVSRFFNFVEESIKKSNALEIRDGRIGKKGKIEDYGRQTNLEDVEAKGYKDLKIVKSL